MENNLKELYGELEALKKKDPATITEDDIARAKALQKEIISEEKRNYVPGEFEKDFTQLYFKDGFLGGVSLGVTKMADFSMPTAYVGVRRNEMEHEIIMGFNPPFLRSLSPRQRRGVIKHELYHLVFQHIFARSIGDPALSMLWNWATDLAINSIIGKDNLPDLCLIPGHTPTDPQTGKPVESVYAEWIQNAPLLQSSEFYFEGLRKLMKEQEDDEDSLQGAAGFGTMDGHDQWSEIPEEVQEEIRSKVNDLVEKGVAKADMSNKWGSTPMEIQDYIRKMLSREVDWRSIVHSFFGRVRSMERNSTMKRINKKMPYIHPGVKRKMRARFACFIDQSGSMSDKDIAQLFGELEGLAKETEIDVFHFDTAIDEESHTVWKKGKQFPKPHRTRCGGTDFNAVSSFCNNPKNPHWDGVVILTDGYAPVMNAIVGSRVLWVITETGSLEIVREGDLAVQMKKDSGQFKPY